MAILTSADSGGTRRKLMPGDCVRITTGQLAGLDGTVVGVNPSGQCVLKIEQLAEGVFVVISESVLVRCERE